MNKLISIIIPAFNEEKNIPPLYESIKEVIAKAGDYDFEIIFINDGSEDGSLSQMRKLEKEDSSVKTIDFSRNFGKEMATTAGINSCQGEACIIIDADLQHPAEKMLDFLSKWEEGGEVIIGIRKTNKGEGIVKKVGSYFFYKLINLISETKIIPNATDFRLLDRVVIEEFNKLTEKTRITRGLIEWLGFRREFVYFDANPRINGRASYGTLKLFKLAFSSIISLTFFPLKIAGYLGIFITVISGALGIFIFITGYITKTMFYTGPAVLAVLILFLIGIVLICLGFIALYIANIHAEVGNRPMYIVRRDKHHEI
jgi:dolichol-phosphate mannosyltransferase